MPDEKKITLLDPNRVDEVVEDQRKLRDAILSGAFSIGGATGGYLTGNELVRQGRSGWSRPKNTLLGLGAGALAGLGISRLSHGKRESQEKFMQKKVQERADLAKRMGYTPEFTANPWKVDENLIRALKSRETRERKRMQKQSNELLEGFDDIDPATEAEINRKLASLRRQYDFKKSAALKAAVDKQAIIDKDVKSNFDQDLDELTDKEPELPKEVQDMMGDRISDALSTAGGAVIIIKPKEFQRMYLRGIGRSDLGEELDSKGMCFKPGAPPDPHFGLSGKMMPDILKMLMPMIMGRSAASPCVNRRIMMIKVVKKPEGDPIELDHPLMDKISSAYSSYRRDLLYNLPTLIKSAMEQPEFRDFWYLDGPPSVTGVVKQGSDVMESLVQMLPVSYTNRAHFQAPISAYVDENPSLDGLIDAGTLI